MKDAILLVEDDIEVAKLIKPALEEAGFEMLHAFDCARGLALFESKSLSAAILDVVVPGGGGFDLCRMIRRSNPRLPIIMLTSKSGEADRVLGLELGADDYVVKPFSVRELIARVRAQLRKSMSTQLSSPEGNQPELVIGELRIDFLRKKVFKRDQCLPLSALEYSLLVFLAQRPGRPFSREQLLSSVWGYDFSGYLHTVNTHVNRLRIKIEDQPASPRYLLTERGMGYRFVEPRELLSAHNEQA